MSQRMTGSEDIRELLLRPITSVSAEELLILFSSGAKQKDDWRLGLEIEVTPFHRENPRAPMDAPTLIRVLDELATEGGFEVEREAGSGIPLALKRSGEIVTVEPAGQVELATIPFKKIIDLQAALELYARQLAASGNRQGVGFWAIGMHPFATVDDVLKLPKARYRAMRASMAGRGLRALDMMHLTGSVQCAVDYSDEANMVAKIRTAAKASTFITALSASSPFTRGKPNGAKSDRTDVWIHTDPARSGLWPEMLDEEGMTLRRYIEKALRVPALFFVRDGTYHAAEEIPFISYGYKGFGGSTITVGDFVDHLTSLFPEIRIKNYLELRGADCTPPAEAAAIAGIWRAILDDETTRKLADERLAAMDFAACQALKPLVSKLGLSAISAAGPVREVAEDLARMAYERFVRAAPDCAPCILPLLRRAEEGRTIADDLLEAEEKHGIEKALELVELR